MWNERTLHFADVPTPSRPNHIKPQTDERLLTFARSMRHEPTDAEKKLWSRLRDRRLGNLKFRRQVPLGGYILDFFCQEAMLALELDGGQHNDEPGFKRDAGRDEALRKLGVETLRFWDPDVLKHTDAVSSMPPPLERRTRPHPRPLPEGEGGRASGRRSG